MVRDFIESTPEVDLRQPGYTALASGHYRYYSVAGRLCNLRARPTVLRRSAAPVRVRSLWPPALRALDRLELDPETINDTLGTLLKYQDDIAKIQGSEAARLLAEVKRELAAAG
jgi:hypothetical protein